MDKNDETRIYLRGFLPRAVYGKMKCLRWYRNNNTGALSMALFIFVSDALRTELHKAGLDDERMSDYYYKAEGAERLHEWCCEMAERIVQRSFAAWGEVAAEIDGRVENDIKAIREAEGWHLKRTPFFHRAPPRGGSNARHGWP